jgi:hypothetical protein
VITLKRRVHMKFYSINFNMVELSIQIGMLPFTISINLNRSILVSHLSLVVSNILFRF